MKSLFAIRYSLFARNRRPDFSGEERRANGETRARGEERRGEE